MAAVLGAVIVTVWGWAALGNPTTGRCAVQSADPPTSKSDSNAAGADDDLAADQARLAEQYRLLEEKLLALSQFEESQNPERARLLQQAFVQSKQTGTLTQLNEAARQLGEDRLREAHQNQKQAVIQLEALLELLQAGDSSSQVADALRRHEEYHQEISRLLNIQRSLRARVETSSDDERTPSAQESLADQTAELAEEIEQNQVAGDESVPPPADVEVAEASTEPRDLAEKLGDRLQAAQQRMRQGAERLASDRQAALEEMQQAEQMLADAKEELEQILRQLREDEVAETLASLESQFTLILERQVKLNGKSASLADLPAARRAERDIECGRLGIEQQSIASDVERALELLADDGTSVAIAETASLVHDDMQSVAARLAAAQLDQATRDTQAEIVDTLGVLIESLKTAQAEASRSRSEGSSESAAGQEPLVDRIAELKMLRALQQRILTRHERYARQLADPDEPVGTVEDQATREALRQLSDQQERLRQITRQIVAEADR
jgi:hypothetical protein